MPDQQQPGAPAATRDLESRVRAGAKWSTLNSAVLSVGGTLLGAVLARTALGPAQWGVYAISQAILVIALSVNELGISAAIIRWDGDVRSFARTVLTLCLAASVALYGALYGVAPFIARLVATPDAAPMLRVLGCCVIADALCAVPVALLNREFAQRRRMCVDCLNFGVTAGTTLLLAYTGHGVMSIAWGGLAGSAVALIAYTAAAPCVVMPGWNTRQAGRLLRFGLPLAGANLFGLAVLNVDSAIVGATLGPVMLGLYQLAFGIASAPVSVISMVVQRVSYAGFSRVADAGIPIMQAFNRTLSLLMALTAPAFVLLATLSGPLVRTVYGNRWVPASGALTLLAVLGLMRVAFVFMNNAMVAADKRTALMKIQGLWLAVLVPALLAGARLGGIAGAAAAHVLVATVIVLPASLWILSRAGITAGSVARACARPALGGALVGAASLSVSRLAGTGVEGLAMAAAAGAGAGLPVLYPMRRLLQRSPQRRDDPGAAEQHSGATAAASLSDLQNSGGLCALRFMT